MEKRNFFPFSAKKSAPCESSHGANRSFHSGIRVTIQGAMNGERLYNLCFNALRLVHWVAFFAVVETMFWFAGLMLFGLLGTFFAWIWFRLTAQNNAKEFLPFFVTSGKYCGLLAGIFATRFVAGRYAKSEKRR